MSAPDIDPELQADLNVLGLQGQLVALVLKRQAGSVVSFAAPIVVLPIPYILSLGTDGQLGEETLALGLRETIRILRSQRVSVLLGETLTSLARASRMTEPLETRLQWIVEAMQIFRTLHAERRLGRAYLDFAVNLKDGKIYYDALHALEQAEDLCGRYDDHGAVAAATYHRGHIYRMIGQPTEALRELQYAWELLPEDRQAESWRLQIRSERIFCNMTLQRFDKALEDLNDWIASGNAHYFPFTYRGEIFERRGDLKSALADYSEASLRLARDIVGRRSERFRRLTSSRNDFVFERALRLALELSDIGSALSLLELLNTGARALQPPEPMNAEPDRDVLSRLAEAAATLQAQAEQALPDPGNELLTTLQDRADLLLAERDLVGLARPMKKGDETVQNTANLQDIYNRIFDLLPRDAIALQYAIVGGQVWVLAATHEVTIAHRTAIGSNELATLKHNIAEECKGLLEPRALSYLQREFLVPVAHLLPQKKRVVITLADAAYGIPFHALQWQGGVLIDTHDVQYVVGGVTMKSALRHPRPRSERQMRWHFVGTPDVSYAQLENLPGVTAECDAVTKLVPEADRRLDLPATSSNLLNQEPADVLHVACHCVFETRAPLMSRLLLADRPVFAFEIALAQLECDIAIIAGCQTASVSSSSGGYVQSLASAFERAGAKTIIASLWPIDDESSAELMQTLYRQFRIHGESSAVAAFCKAQRALHKRAEFEALDWAPLVVFEELSG